MWNEPSKQVLNNLPGLYATEEVPLKEKLIQLWLIHSVVKFNAVNVVRSTFTTIATFMIEIAGTRHKLKKKNNKQRELLAAAG